MSGHSRWSNIKRKKDVVDKKKGATFHRISKELMVASRLGGSDPSANSRLRIAMSRARDANMTRDSIERSIKKGAGELESVVYEEVVYEAFGQGGVGLVIESLTDKKSRTTPEIKNILSKHQASLAEGNAVLRLFEKNGVLNLTSEGVDESKLFEIVVEAGAKDLILNQEEKCFEVITQIKYFSNVSDALHKNNYTILDSGIHQIPLNENVLVPIHNLEQALKITKLIDALESHEDVQSVYNNMLLSNEIIKEISK